jgi:hypothetical protein
LRHRDELLSSGEWAPEQLGLFAEETGAGGVRRYFVDTFAGFSADVAEGPRGGHLYEVVQEERPCWLYFDLEFSRPANPALQADEVMSQFHQALAGFCATEGLPYNASLTVVLDSSTEVKFSKHVIVKSLAFQSNFQAGQFVDMFVAYARGITPSGTKCLFAREASDDALATKPVVDTSVYSRNRCFRVLHQSKWGKDAVFELQDGGCVVQAQSLPYLQVLRTLASFVPSGTTMCKHARISTSARHRIGRVCGSAEVDGELKPLMDWLIHTWDAERAKVECVSAQPTYVQKVSENRDGVLEVVLRHNRFCLDRGRSHKSNHIVLQVYKKFGIMEQSCFDRDCSAQRKARHRRRFRVPKELLPPS